jgi:hypothetical protein
MEALQTKASITQCAAVYALRKFGPKSVIALPRLRALTKAPEALVRQAAEGTLVELSKSEWLRNQ